jgi:acetyl-CoA carboxylase carboxyl transferase subunit beta
MSRTGARALLDLVLDPGTWESWDAPVTDTAAPGSSYAEELAAARAATGLDEAVVTGAGSIAGRRVAVVVTEFDFLAGSIGVAAAGRIIAAVERATAERLPLVASPTSGGTRMQEGTVAFVQMVAIGAAVHAHRAAGLPYLVYLRHPTTGGVFASWGSLGHVTAAEPGALVGFLGPRVSEALTGTPFPDDIQRAENLFAHGLLDAVMPPEQLGAVAAAALAVLDPRDHHAPSDGDGDVPAPADLEDVTTEVDAWTAVERSRRPERPGVRALLRIAATDVTPLNGTGDGDRGTGLLLALARFDGRPCVVLGQDRRDAALRPLGPGALRTGRRGMRIAAELGLPLVTVIDTAGAALTREAEEGGLGGEIARSLVDLVDLGAPTLCVLLGQGGGGGALALVPADRVLAAQHAWLSPLPPEGASAIRHRTVAQAPRLAREQGISATRLRAAGIVDRIVAESPDAADEPEAFCRRLGAAIATELDVVRRLPATDRAARRAARYRAVGR